MYHDFLDQGDSRGHIMDTLKPKNSKSITFTVRGFLYILGDPGLLCGAPRGCGGGMQIEREPDRCTFAGKFVEKSCFIVLNREVSKLESNHKIKENLLFFHPYQFLS